RGTAASTSPRSPGSARTRYARTCGGCTRSSASRTARTSCGSSSRPSPARVRDGRARRRARSRRRPTRRSSTATTRWTERPMLRRLEPLSTAHLAGVMTWVNDRDVMQYFANRQTPIAEDEERAYLKELLGSKADRAWSIFWSDEYVGQCSINQIYW